MSARLLPPNATALERAIADSSAIAQLPVPARDVRNPAQCPAALLPWLAWELSVDEWDDSWSEQRKRSVIAASVQVHQRKGTVGAIRRALTAAGYPDAQIDERRHGWRRDGTVRRDGWPTHGAAVPFIYRVRLGGLISQRQAEQLHALLRSVAPVRCRLHSLDFRGATLRHNGAATRNAEYTRGQVNV